MEPILNPDSSPMDAEAVERPLGEGPAIQDEAPLTEGADQYATSPAAPRPPSALEPPPAGADSAPANVEPRGADGMALALLHAQSQSVIEHLERFEAQLAEQLRNNASCNRTAFDNLYDEMQAYKRNFLSEAQRPLLLDLMMLYDSIDKLRRGYELASSVDPVTLSQNLDALQVEAEEILGRVGIERMSETPDKLDVNFQRAVKAVPTDDPEEHLLVVEHLVSGFVSGGRALRKEQVVVKKFTPRAPGGGDRAE